MSASGALVGVNVAGLSRGSLVTFPGSSVERIVDALVRHGHVRRARLGVALQRVELPGAAAERLGRRRGLIVLSVVADGPAERAGVLLGDVIVAVGDRAVERVDELQAALGEHSIAAELGVQLAPGERVRAELVGDDPASDLA